MSAWLNLGRWGWVKKEETFWRRPRKSCCGGEVEELGSGWMLRNNLQSLEGKAWKARGRWDAKEGRVSRREGSLGSCITERSWRIRPGEQLMDLT